MVVLNILFTCEIREQWTFLFTCGQFQCHGESRARTEHRWVKYDFAQSTQEEKQTFRVSECCEDNLRDWECGQEVGILGEIFFRCGAWEQKADYTNLGRFLGCWLRNWELNRHQRIVRKPWWFSGEGSACQCRRCRRCGLSPRVRKIPWGGGKASTAVSLPGKSHGQQSLADYRPWDQSQTQLSE